MKKYVYIALGGILGAVARFWLKGLDLHGLHTWLPLNTLIVNIAGCFLLGLVLTAANGALRIDEVLKLGIATGFLGAFTTFSTLCREAAELICKGMLIQAIAYAAVSAVLGLAAVYLGALTARSAFAGLKNNDRDRDRDKGDMDGSGLNAEGGVE